MLTVRCMTCSKFSTGDGGQYQEAFLQPRSSVRAINLRAIA
jgi:hypothetical protein